MRRFITYAINVDVLTITSVDCRFITYAINVDVLTITSVDCRFITYAINVDVLTITSNYNFCRLSIYYLCDQC